jgi:addiction module HigA family antidote
VLLEDFMQPLGISAYRVAKDLSLAPITVSQILRGLRSISPAVACRLGTYLGVPPAYWLLVQASYEAHSAAIAGAANSTQICEALQSNNILQEALRAKAFKTSFLGRNENQSPNHSPNGVEPSEASAGEDEGLVNAIIEPALARSRIDSAKHQSKRRPRQQTKRKKT